MPGVANAWNAYATSAKISELDKRIAARRQERAAAAATTQKKKKKKNQNQYSLQDRVQQLKGVNKTRRDILRELDN